MNENIFSQEPNETTRRDLLKGAAVTAVGLVAGAALSEEAAAQGKAKPADSAMTNRMAILKDSVALNSKGVLPDGKTLSRAQVLAQLNLNPNTAPEAWLAIIMCGVNASALNFKDAERLVKNGVLDSAALQTIRKQ